MSYVVTENVTCNLTNKTDGGGVIVPLFNKTIFEVLAMKEVADLVPKINLVFCKCSLNKFVFFLIVVYVPPDIYNTLMIMKHFLKPN